MKISIHVDIAAPVEDVWRSWVTPSDIMQWNHAIDAWHCPAARNDLRVGGAFCYRMEAKDGSIGFDFEGTYTAVEVPSRLEFKLEDDRLVTVEIEATASGARLTETFEAEDANSAEQQRQGWQAILENFKSYVESKGL